MGRFFDGCNMVCDRQPITAPPIIGSCRVCGATPTSCRSQFGGTCCEGCRADPDVAHPTTLGPRLAGTFDQLRRRRCRSRLTRTLHGLPDAREHFGRCELVHHPRGVPHALERGMHWTRWLNDAPEQSWVDVA